MRGVLIALKNVIWYDRECKIKQWNIEGNRIEKYKGYTEEEDRKHPLDGKHPPDMDYRPFGNSGICSGMYLLL